MNLNERHELIEIICKNTEYDRPCSRDLMNDSIWKIFAFDVALKTHRLHLLPVKEFKDVLADVYGEFLKADEINNVRGIDKRFVEETRYMANTWVKWWFAGEIHADLNSKFMMGSSIKRIDEELLHLLLKSDAFYIFQKYFRYIFRCVIYRLRFCSNPGCFYAIERCGRHIHDGLWEKYYSVRKTRCDDLNLCFR